MKTLTTISCPRVVIAALRGSAGKTTTTLGLITALRKRGQRVAPAKKGPDYIDAAWHTVAAGRACRNLDTFLIDRADIVRSFARAVRGADVAIVEGNRGLYDGMDADGAHSTAELAKLLHAPVILVCECSKVTRTTAAMVLGCQHMDPDVRIAGVILNRVRGSRHQAMATAAIERTCGVPVLGALPVHDEMLVPERHLGLAPPCELVGRDDVISRLGEIVAEHVDLDAIGRILKEMPDFRVDLADNQLQEHRPRASGDSRPRIGIVRDRAFWFYYADNIEALESRGAEIVWVDSLRDPTLPDVDALYIGGGFPETQAEQLSGNASFRASVRQAVDDGLPVYAECGGLIYLGRTLECDGRRWPMAGVLPATFRLERRPQAHGYVVFEVDRANPFYPQGLVLRGHEFHYTHVVDGAPSPKQLAFQVRRGTGITGCREGWTHKNVLATYGHVHALSATAWADSIVRLAAERADPVVARR